MDGTDVGLLVIRVVVGGLVLGHGLGNLFGWIGGFGLGGTGEIFERLGFRPGRRYAAVAGVTELGAGALLLVGFATALGAAAVVGVMVNAIRTAHRGKGPWYYNGGWEYNVTLLAVSAAIAFTGAGVASIDALLGLGDASIAIGIASSAVGLAAGAAVLALRLPRTPSQLATIADEAT